MDNIWSNPIIVGVVVAIPSFILGYLGYLRSIKSDKVAEDSTIASTNTAAINQVIDGLNNLIDGLQEDNKDLRESVISLSVKLKETIRENSQLAKQVEDIRKKYGIRRQK